MKEETKGEIVSKIPWAIFLGMGLWDWYKTNPYHKFNEGDILILRPPRNTIAYGRRPVIVVRGYEVREEDFGFGGWYDVISHRDPREKEGIERIVEKVVRSKWIEKHFTKVRCKTVEEALELYGNEEDRL